MASIISRETLSRAEGQIAPASFTQQQAWALDQLMPENNFNTISITIHVKQALSTQTLAQSLNTLLDRHATLRTTFRSPAQQSQPLQVVAPRLTMPLSVVDLRPLQAEQRETEAQRLASEESQRPFDMSQGPLVRACLLQLDTEECLLLLNVHHSICDTWSLKLLLHELATLYEAFASGQPSPLSEPPQPYTEFAQRQLAWLQEEEATAALAYWKQQLADSPDALKLPTNCRQSPVPTYQSSTLSLTLSRTLSKHLRELEQREDVSLEIILLAALLCLLYRYTGQEDLVIGRVTAGYRPEGNETTLGLFENILALRTSLTDNLPFHQLLERVHETIQEAQAHQKLPFEYLIKELYPTHSLDQNPLFQVMLTVSPSVSLPLGWTLRQMECGTSHSNLSLEIEEQAEDLLVNFKYRHDLFDEATITRMTEHWQTLLEGIVTDPTQPIARLPLLTEQERHQLLVEWNTPQVEYFQDHCIHELFEAQAERTPEAVAVVCEGEQLTYEELNQQANQLACHLRKMGIHEEVSVGLCIEPSVKVIVSLLAILKAGGVYVPMDPTYPPERIAFMAQETKMPLLITEQHLLTRLGQSPLQLVCLDTDWPTISQHPTTNLPHTVKGDHLAYIIFTSGSTGQPKGVLIEHQSIASHCGAMIEAQQLSAADCCLQLNAFTFDASLEQILPPLLVGARLVLHGSDIWSPAEFLQQAKDHQFTVVTGPCGYWHEVISHWATLPPEHLSGLRLRRMGAGGDRLSLEAVQLWRQLPLPSLQLFNLYGPTEGTITTTLFDLPRHPEPELPETNIPIGRPLSNRCIYLLDKLGQPVPQGVAGELHIGGRMLARGYLNHPELTSERFIIDPFSERPQARLYKTGDLARYLPGGLIEFVGRVDHQVKIRGFRIELGEIETVIALHPAVFQTVVLVREDIPSVKRLVAYVVPRPDQETSEVVAQLRSLLKERLPDYMIPAAIVLLETFPLNASGKVDRHALPAPDFTGSEHQENFVAPRTPLEEGVARTWTKVLGLEQISIHDDFFALGGDSLLGMQVLSRLQTLLDITIPLRRFFEAPTIAQLAEAISQLQASHSQSDKLGLHKLTKEDYYLPTTENASVSKHAVYAYPVSPTQEGLWFLQQLEPESVAYNISVILRVHKPLDIEILKRSLNALVQRHDALRTAFGMHEGKPVQLVTSTLALDLPVLDLQHLPKHERDAEALKRASTEAQRPFDLAQAPLFRSLLMQLTAEESVLVLTIHHIIVDGWSLSVLLPELVSLYEAFASGQPSPLQDQPLQYTDFSVWQREQLQEGQFAKQLAYWKEQLAHASDVLELPTTHPRTAQISSKGATYFLTLPQVLTDQLKHLSRQQGATLYMTLMAAFQTLLHRYTGQEDLLIGTVAANRQAETKETVGFFINTLVLRGDLSGDPSFSALLAHSREAVLTAQANQELPFTSLVQAIRPERQSGHTPLFQVMMRFDTPFPDLPKGWELINAGNLTATAQFELSLEVQEVSEGLGCRFEYYTDLFDEAAIARLAGHWQTLLAGIVANPNQPLSTLPLLTEQEHQQMLVEWNATQTAYPLEQCFHQLFEAQVRQTPKAVAVVCEDEQLSYQELNARANQLAHWLRERGVGPNKLVALLADRGIPFLVSILAVFKAGGAYLPLDPHHPAARLRKVIELSRCSIVLATTAFAPTVTSALEDVPSELCPEPLYYETILQTSQNTENLPVCSIPCDLAYVIYTSGSTGQPKGAMVEQRGMVNHIYAKIDALALTNKDTVAQTASQCFDISVWQFLAILLVGGRVQIYLDEVAHHPVQLLTQVEHHRVSILETVPSLLGAMLDADEIGATSRPKLAALRWLIPTGEALPVELCRRWLHTYPHIPLLNAYGPTECSDDVTHYPIYEAPNEMNSIPIGKAIPNMRLYVLDRRMQPLPIGVNGELYVGGIGVGRGYLGDERRTRETFVRDPFGSEESARLYKTGDLVRYLPDGNIDFLGRLDFQVKLRGFRIELGEIEVVLSQHPAVRLVVVVVREDIPGDKRLVAYVELQKDQTTTAAELKNHVKKQVPAYMVPSAFVLLEKLPLTPNGKVDRRALPVPEQGRSVAEESYVPPSLPVEKQLVQIWEKLLGVQPIGIKDDFFELGGNSLLGVQLFDQMAQVFGKKLPLSTLFGGATIEHLAKALAGESTTTLPAEIKTDERAGLVAVQTGGSKRPFFFLHGQWVNSALYSLDLAHALGPDQPFYLLEPYKYQDLVPLPTFEEVAAAYIKALRAVQPEGPYLLGGWCNGAIWAYEIARQLHAQGQKTDLLVMMDPDVPAQHEQERHVITGLGNLLGLSTETQADWFLGYRHVRRTFYYWRLSKLKHTRAIKENRSLFEPNPIPPKPSEFIPRREVVRGWPNIYEWMLAGYRPHFYPGKVAFFWTEEEPHRRENWRRTMETQIQADNVEVYIIPGNHITSRTEHLPTFAERFRECLTKI